MTVKRLFEIKSSEDPKTPIQFKFLCWLFLYASIAFVASLILSLTFATLAARKEVRQVIQSKISDAYEHSKISNDALKTLKSMTAQVGVQRARALALLIQSDPSILKEGDVETTTVNLGKIARLIKVDEIDVTDENGFIIASWPTGATEIGYNMGSGSEAREFLPILSNPDLEISQEIRPTEGANDSKLYQFSAVARRDRVGIIEVGFRAEDVEDAYNLANISNYISSVVGYDGFLWVYQGPNAIKKPGSNEVESDAKTSGKSEVSEYLDGQISGPKFTQASVEELQKLPLEKVVVRRLRDFVSDKSVPYLVFAQDLYLEENESPYRFVGGISQQEIYRSRRMLVNLLALANFIVFFTIFTLISKLVKRLIVDSVYAVNESLERITKGNLNERVDVKVSREFVDLSNGVNATVDSLKQVVDEVRQSVERELVLAKKIQEASLPNIENLYSDRDEFDVYAKNRPMRSVGGDMYDFFYLDPENILFYIADVSGHGVPGALIMMKTMALVKNLALSGYPLEKVVALTNASLSENNDSSFVTGFFCVINLKTGDLTYVNAGHNSPFIRQGSGQFVEFTPEINLILGILPEAEYVSQTIKLNPGDVFVLFTDGITEATTPTMAGCFETDAALNVLNSLPSDATAKESVEALFEAVAKFTNYEEPSDDETILFFHYLRPSS